MGKGSHRRHCQVSAETWSSNYSRTFGGGHGERNELPPDSVLPRGCTEPRCYLCNGELDHSGEMIECQGCGTEFERTTGYWDVGPSGRQAIWVPHLRRTSGP